MFKDPIDSKELTITDVLQSEEIEINKVPYICYYEGEVKGTDRCFGYARKGSPELFIFQIESTFFDKNVSRDLLNGLDMENPGFLTALVEEAKELVEVTPMNISSPKDLSTEIEIEWDTFSITYQSRDAVILKKSLYKQYCERVIKRNS